MTTLISMVPVVALAGTSALVIAAFVLTLLSWRRLVRVAPEQAATLLAHAQIPGTFMVPPGERFLGSLRRWSAMAAFVLSRRSRMLGDERLARLGDAAFRCQIAVVLWFGLGLPLLMICSTWRR